jgi:putative inorganic carbon (hco3(-)) transporter
VTVLAGINADPLLRRRIQVGLVALAITGTAFAVGMVVVDRPIVVMLGVVGLLVGMASLAKPNAATYAVVAVLYSNAAAVAVSHHGLPYFIGLAFPLALAIPLADQLLLRRKTVTITTAFPFLLGYLLVQLASTAAARDVSNALDWLVIFLIGGFGLYFVITNVVRNFDVLHKIVWIILLCGAAMGALSTFQYVTQTWDNNYFGFSQSDLPGVGRAQLTESLSGTPRAAGPIGEKNRYAQVMLVLLPIGALVAYSQRRRATRVLALSLTVLILLGMATTFSRGAALGLLAILIVAFLFRYLRPVHMVAILVAFALVLTAFPRYVERIQNLEGLAYIDRTARTGPPVGDVGNLRARATESLTALYIFLDHPIIGVGRGQSSGYHKEYAKQLAAAGFDARIRETKRSHNLYLGIAAETGALGFLFFMGIFIITLRDLYRARRLTLRTRPEVAHLAAGFFLAIVGYMVSAIALHLSYERYLWVLLALAGITAHLALRGEDTDRPVEGDQLGQGQRAAAAPIPAPNRP